MTRTPIVLTALLLSTGALLAEVATFSALVLPTTSGKAIGPARDYNYQIKQLGIHATYATVQEVESGAIWDKLGQCDMLLVPPGFTGRATNNVEKLRSWLKNGGYFFLHDAVYPARLHWLKDIDPQLELKCGGCQYKSREVIRNHSLLTHPAKVGCGGYWGHLTCPTGTLWEAIYNCPHTDKGSCGLAIARYGKGVVLAHSQYIGDTTPLIRNLRANAALLANHLTLTALEAPTPVAGENTFLAEVKNEGPKPQKVELCFNGTQSTSVEIPPQASQTLRLTATLKERGMQRCRLELRCNGLASILFDQEVRIRKLFEIGSTRYRNLLSPGRRFEQIAFFSMLSPIDEDVTHTKVVLETLAGEEVVGRSETSAQAGAFKSFAHIPLNLPPAQYRIKGTLVDQSGKVLACDETTVEILPPTPGLTCIDEDLNFIVDEEPFLPLGLYHVTPAQYDEAGEMGINMINQFGWEWSRSITEAFIRGWRVVFQPFQFGNKGNVDHYAHNPGLMQWYLLDEPGEADIPRGESLNHDFHTYDKTHPTYLVSCTPQLFDRFGVMADVFAPDPYPHTWDDPEIVARWMDKAYEVCGERHPLVCIPQSHLMETHAEWLAMTHLALCHRSKGIFWYCWAQQSGGTVGVGIRNNEHRRDLPLLIGRFRAMEPALLNSKSADYFVTNGIHGMSCQDPNLGTRYMIVVNPKTNGASITCNVTWKGASATNQFAKGAFTHHTFPMQNGVVQLTLAPLEHTILSVDGTVPAPVLLPPPPETPQGTVTIHRVGPNEPFKTIQSAIDAANPGDEIIVSPGIYEPISSANKHLKIRSVEGPTKTILDGKGSQRCAELTARPFGSMVDQTNTVLIGFTLRNGRAAHTQHHKHRGGLALGGHYRNCLFTGGEAQYGGALAYGFVAESHFASNRATKCGGALAFSTAEQCHFEANTCDYDGGAVAFSNLTECKLINNQSNRDAGAMFYGDALRSTFIANTAKRNGGAIFTQDGAVRGCLIASNRADRVGGGVYWSSIRLSTIVDNVAPEGSGYFNKENGLAEGCIIWRNEAVGVGRSAGSLIGTDPRFLPNTFIPSPTSPAIDYARLSPLCDSERDLAGNSRLQGNALDAGAFESQSTTPPNFLKRPTVILDVSTSNALALAEQTLQANWPTGAIVPELEITARFRYRKPASSSPFGVALQLEMPNDLRLSIGTYQKHPKAAGQFFGRVAYRQRISCDGEKWQAKSRVKESSTKQVAQREQWHEVQFRVNALGRNLQISRLLVDGVEASVDYPWSIEHNEMLSFSDPKLILAKGVEFERITITAHPKRQAE